MRCGILAILVFAMVSPGVAQTASAPATKAVCKASSGRDCCGQSLLAEHLGRMDISDLEKQGSFYAQGPGHLFFDVAPLKYDSWDDYKAGVAPSLKDAPKVTYTLDDDLQIHPEGKITWVAGTLKMAGATPQGQKEIVTLRWTAVLELQDGRWLITHEHVSAPAEAAPATVVRSQDL